MPAHPARRPAGGQHDRDAVGPPAVQLGDGRRADRVVPAQQRAVHVAGDQPRPPVRHRPQHRLEVAGDAVDVVPAGELRRRRADRGVGVGHGHGAAAGGRHRADHRQVVGHVPEDEDVAEADAVPLQRDGQAAGLGDARRQHLDEAEAGVGHLGVGRVDDALRASASSSSWSRVAERRKTLRTAPGRQHLVPRQQVRRLGVGPVEAVLHAQRGARGPRACSAASSTATIELAGDRLDPLDRRRAACVAGQPDGAQHLVALQVDDVAALREDGDAAAVQRVAHAVQQPRAAAGDADDRDAGVPAGGQRRAGARADLAGGVEQRAVEVGGHQLGPPAVRARGGGRPPGRRRAGRRGP